MKTPVQDMHNTLSTTSITAAVTKGDYPHYYHLHSLLRHALYSIV